MTRHLLDVNVLFAMIWPKHESHSAAHSWFSEAGHRAWATNPLSQLGVLRLLTNTAVTHGLVGTATALGVLTEAMAHPGHEFWPLDRQVSLLPEMLISRIRGHRQWTDAILLWQASKRDGVLVTFDSGLKELAGREFQNYIALLRRG